MGKQTQNSLLVNHSLYSGGDPGICLKEKKEDKDNFIEKYLAKGDCPNISGGGKNRMH